MSSSGSRFHSPGELLPVSVVVARQARDCLCKVDTDCLYNIATCPQSVWCMFVPGLAQGNALFNCVVVIQGFPAVGRKSEH